MYVNNKIGLALAGGGAKGAYQLGVWYALKQLGIDEKIKVISGTSIGALNGLLMAMGDMNSCLRFWQKAAIMPSSSSLVKTVSKVMGHKNAAAVDNLVNHPFLSSAKLGAVLDEVIDLNKINKTLYVTCHDLKKRKSTYFRVNNLNKDQIKKVLLASSCLPGIFKKQSFNGSSYIDGGISDNVPIKPLLYEKCTIIIVVYLKKPKMLLRQPQIIEIIPSINLGAFRDGTLNFYQEKLRLLIKTGYQDAFAALYPHLAALSLPLKSG